VSAALIAAARAAFIAGFGATSNLEAGRTWGIPTMGTAAHSFTLLHDSEEEAFEAQVDALGPGTHPPRGHLRHRDGGRPRA
jgi:nicotinate phosphoribosyltransferase